MPYTVIETALPGVLILEPRVFEDERGFFFESFNAQDFAQATGVDSVFVQDNHSASTKGVLRGLHFQKQHPQGKLLRVAVGEIFDVAVDIRPNSKTYAQWVGVNLSADNRRQLWVPEGFAHGFLVTSDVAEVMYKVTDYYRPSDEGCIVWNDPTIGVSWPIDGLPVLSEKDARGEALV